MYPTSPRPLALFSLIPVSAAARAAVNHPNNDTFVSEGDNGPVFDIGHTQPKPCGTLVTLGRGPEADIFLGSCFIAKSQCSFMIDPDTKVIMLHDLSHQRSTQPFGPESVPFEGDRKRQVVVCRNVNTQLGMGGANRDIYTFTLKWHQSLTEIMAQAEVEKEARPSTSYQINPRISRTVDEKDTAALTPHYDTRPQLPPRPKIRYTPLQEPELGSGQFGTVYRVLNLDSGKCIAIKKLSQPAANDQIKAAVENEISTLSRLTHPHIIEFLGVVHDTSKLGILMALKEGNVKSLVNKILQESSTTEKCKDMMTTVQQTILPQMLSALDFLQYNLVVHRDVKPENILYATTSEGRYSFFLADFGLCKKSDLAQTTCIGTKLFMAPEVFRGTDDQDKADIWSLFVTMLWVLNANNFREESDAFKRYPQAFNATVRAAENSAIVENIREMAIQKPKFRASAAQMLRKLGYSRDLTTPEDRIPPLIPYPGTRTPYPVLGSSQHGSQDPAPRQEETSTSTSSAVTETGSIPAPPPLAPPPLAPPLLAPPLLAPPPLAPPSDPPAAPPRRSARIRNRNK